MRRNQRTALLNTVPKPLLTEVVRAIQQTKSIEYTCTSLKGLRLEELGSGGSRTAYALNDRLALKVARYRDGIQQNRHEVRTSKEWRGNEITKVVDSDKAGRWLIVERAIPYKWNDKTVRDTFKAAMSNVSDYGMSYLDMALRHVIFNHNEKCGCSENTIDFANNAKNLGWFKSMVSNLGKIKAKTGVLEEEFYLDLSERNMGVVKNEDGSHRVVIVDYGWCCRK